MGVTTAVAAGVGAATQVGQAIAGSGASQSAGAQQSAADLQAAQLQAQEFQQVQKELSPFVDYGQAATRALATGTGLLPGGNTLTSTLTQPFQPTEAQLAATPGYQFTKDQGLQGVQNSFAAQGLANSGAALKGAASFATGLADTTYQQQFGNYLTQNQQIYNMLSGIANTGESAAAGVGGLGTQLAGNAGSLTAAAGAAGAAGTVGSTNALFNGLGNAAGQVLTIGQLLQPTLSPVNSDLSLTPSIGASGGSFLSPDVQTIPLIGGQQ